MTHKGTKYTAIVAAILSSLFFAAGSIAQASKWDQPPAIKKSVSPTNPSKISGMVSAIVTIKEDGTVADAKISKSTDASLEGPVLDALKEWRFSPAKLDGKAVQATIKVPFKFSS